MLQISDKLKKFRKLRGLSQQEVADEIGEKRSTYAHWEQGGTPKSDVLPRLAKVLHVDIDDILSTDEVQEPGATYQQRRLYRKLTEGSSDVPVYNGSTTLGNITLFSDENKEQIATLPQTVFPGCDYAEKASGDSMYPLIMNQALLVGRKCPPTRAYVLPLANDGISKKVSEFYSKIKR